MRDGAGKATTANTTKETATINANDRQPAPLNDHTPASTAKLTHESSRRVAEQPPAQQRCTHVKCTWHTLHRPSRVIVRVLSDMHAAQKKDSTSSSLLSGAIPASSGKARPACAGHPRHRDPTTSLPPDYVTPPISQRRQVAYVHYMHTYMRACIQLSPLHCAPPLPRVHPALLNP